MRRTVRLVMPLMSILFALSAHPALGQSTIFNVPTTDTVAKGNVYFEFDWLAQRPNTRGLDRLHLFRPKVVSGISNNLEVGLTVPVHYRGPFSTDWFYEPSVKWKFISREKEGTAAAVGGALVRPVNNQFPEDTFVLVYGNFSQRVNGKYGPRFTAGPYGIVGAEPSWSGPKAGVILGYEQPIHAKVNIAADWYSGQNRYGYLTGGISLKLPANSVVNAGYSFGNNSYRIDGENEFLFLRYGITFP